MTGAGPGKDPARIAAMFDAIAGRYDLLNRLLSAGLDRRWRRRAIRALGLTGRETLVDLCTGTADLAIAAVRAGRHGAARVVGIDFAEAMLRLGWRKLARLATGRAVRLVRADAMRLPLAPGSAEAAAVAFGIRNVEDPAVAVREIYQVLKPGGRLAVLEFGFPSVPGLRAVYLWYFQRVLPRIGRLVSRHADAYTYLPASVGTFPTTGAFAALLRDAGFVRVEASPLSLGIVVLYVAERD